MDHYIPMAEVIGFKGINADFLEELLPHPDNPVYLTDADNLLIKGGGIGKLPGVDHLNGITSQRGVGTDRRILSMPIYETYGQYKRLMVFTPGQVEYLSSDSGFSDIGALNGSADSIVSFVNADNLAVFTLNDDPVIRKWDSITMTELVDSAAIRSRFLMKYKTWLILVRPLQYVVSEWVERYQEIWPSYPGDIDNFDVEDRLMIAAGGAINGCRMLEDMPIVYFPDSIHRVYRISDQAGFGSQPISETVGLLSPRTLTSGSAVHYFLSKEGMMKMIAGAAPAPMSWMKFNKIIIDNIDPLYYGKAIARFFDDTGLLYIAFPPAGTSDNGTMLIYDTIDDELVGKKTLSRVYAAFGTFEKDLTDLTPDERRNYGVGGIPIIGTDDGHVLEQRYTEYQDTGTNFVSGMTLPPFFFGNRHKNKRIMQVDLFIEKETSNDITFELEISDEMNVKSVTPYTVTGDGGAGIRRYEIKDVDVFGKEFRPVLRDKDNPYGYKIHGMIFRGYVTTLK